jgi:hypothetical protein
MREVRRSRRLGADGREETHRSTPSIPCRRRRVNFCASAAAWAWVDDLVSLTRQGDPDARRVLPLAIAHYLQSEREVCRGTPA